jgi:hypothetical protein
MRSIGDLREEARPGTSPDALLLFRMETTGGGPIWMPQLSIGSMIMAKLVRARFSRLFTVPTLMPVSSAISS